jgi:hydrophobe/amphiphile efflux-3 (HAE3) family protein
MWNGVARVLVRRPLVVLVITLAATVGLSLGLLGIEFRTSQDTLVSAGSQVYRDNSRYQDQFGGESMLVLLTGDPVDLFTTENIGSLQQLETDLRATEGVETVVGPYGAVLYAADQLVAAPALLADAAARADDPAAVQSRIQSETTRLSAAGEQTLSNPDFVRFLIYADDGSIRTAQKTTFLDDGGSLLIVRMVGNAPIDEQAQVSHAIKDVVDRYHFDGHELLATGTPVLLDEINAYLQGGMSTLGLIAVLVMLIVLWLAFRVRLRLLPLAAVAAGTAAALGLAGYVGIALSLVTISGLPIFIGLGVDFAIQVHNRYVEQRAEGDAPAEAATVAVSRMGPPLTVAMIAGAFGFLALRLSPVPMIRDFGLLLCLGVVVLVVVALLLPATILVLVESRRPRGRSAWRDGPGIVERGVGRLTSLGRTPVLAVLAVGVVVAAAGFLVEGRMPIETEAERWVSPTGTAVRELTELRDSTGFSDELGFMIQADDVTADDVVAWMYAFQNEELQRHAGELLSAASMPGVAADVVGITPSGNDVRTLFEIAPRDIQASLMTEDRHTANLVFPIGHISLSARGRLVESIKDDLKGDLAPPAGVTATPSGLAVIGIELVHGMEANRSVLTLAALGLVGAWLLVRGRLRPRAVLPLVPIAVAVGSATFICWALGFKLTPLTTVAAPLVIAVATEFAVLLEARYEEERRNGRTPVAAVAHGLPRIGRAFVASGLTLIGGFGVMAASPMPLLRDFGIVVSIDVVIALACALVIMPPLLRWTDRSDRRRPAEPAVGRPVDDEVVDLTAGDRLITHGGPR